MRIFEKDGNIFLNETPKVTVGLGQPEPIRETGKFQETTRHLVS